MNQPSLVLFDLGGVLVNWHNSWLIKEVSQRYALDEDKLQTEFDKHLADLSTGRINEGVFWSRIGSVLESSHLQNLQSSLLYDIFKKFMKKNDLVLELSRALKNKNVKIGILSNTEPVTFSVVEEMNLLNHFDFKFLSYEIGLIKPDKKIYEFVLASVPFNPENLLFIDDLRENIESAISSGIDSIQFHSFEQLMSSLRTRNII